MEYESPPQSEELVGPAQAASVTQQELFRLRRLLWILGVAVVLLLVPTLIERVQYAFTAGAERARYDVAREHMPTMNLGMISDASRLLAQYVGPSVVNVSTSRGRAQGSGVIVDPAGYIVTNEHVVRGARTAEIQLSDGRRGTASVVGRDAGVDVAVLKTELDDLIAAMWGDSDHLDVGDLVWAVGSPFGLQQTITFGIVSAKERRGYMGVYKEFLQTDAAVNRGSSGGPLVNVAGEVVGINTAIIGSTFQGISFSIPSVIARKSYEQLRETGWVERGFLGVRPAAVSDKVARRLGLNREQGVLITRVEEGAPASVAGLEPGDVILSWDGIEFSDPTLMSRAIAATKIGKVVPVQIMRYRQGGAQKLTLQVQVAARPPDSL